MANDQSSRDDEDDLTPRQRRVALLIGFALLGTLTIMRGLWLEDLSFGDSLLVALLVVAIAGTIGLFSFLRSRRRT